MQEFEDITYHIYAKDRCLYHSLNEEEFEEKWQLLNVMIELISSDYNKDDLSYTKLSGKVGYGGPGKVLYTEPSGDHSF
jgi:hypothetical protein